MVVPTSPAAVTSSASLWSSAPGHELLGLVARKRLRRRDAAREPQRIDGDPAVLGGREIVRLDRRCRARIGSLQPDEAARGRLEVADACREGREGVQRLPETIEREGLNVLRGNHRERAGTEQQILQPDPHLAAPAVHQLVQRPHVTHLEGHAQLQVILQVLAHTGKVVRHRAGKRDQAPRYLANAAMMYRDMDMRFWLEQTEAEIRELA